jgi:hypothetical protein
MFTKTEQMMAERIQNTLDRGWYEGKLFAAAEHAAELQDALRRKSPGLSAIALRQLRGEVEQPEELDREAFYTKVEGARREVLKALFDLSVRISWAREKDGKVLSSRPRAEIARLALAELRRAHGLLTDAYRTLVAPVAIEAVEAALDTAEDAVDTADHAEQEARERFALRAKRLADQALRNKHSRRR